MTLLEQYFDCMRKGDHIALADLFDKMCIRDRGIYVITGGTTGIGAATRMLLEDWGHEVFNIDYQGGDFQADLSCEEGVRSAIEVVYERYPDGIDGLISNAGVGPTAPPEKIFALNFYAGIEIAEGLRPLLKKKRGCCVMTSSNSITNDTVRMDWVELLTNLRNKERGLELGRMIPREQGASVYLLPASSGFL